jgi:hypothetical protein
LPVPARATVGGVPGALVLTLSIALTVPAADGENSMEFVQLAPAASGEMQVVADLMKEPAPVPPNVLPSSVRGVEPMI